MELKNKEMLKKNIFEVDPKFDLIIMKDGEWIFGDCMEWTSSAVMRFNVGNLLDKHEQELRKDFSKFFKYIEDRLGGNDANV